MITRRDFLKMAGTASVVGALKPDFAFADVMNTFSEVNKLPRWRGFNLLDFFSPVKRGPNDWNASLTTENDFKWMADWGFDFVRIPMAYPSYLQFDPKGDPNKRITKEEVLQFDESAIERVDHLITKANQQGLHVSLNLHRAPGFCINAGFHEPYNLWRDKEAQEALYAHWEMWA